MFENPCLNFSDLNSDSYLAISSIYSLSFFFRSTGSRAPSRAKQPTAKESSDANGDAPKEEKKKKPLPPKPWLRKKTGAKPPPPSDDAADIVICLPGNNNNIIKEANLCC